MSVSRVSLAVLITLAAAITVPANPLSAETDPSLQVRPKSDWTKVPWTRDNRRFEEARRQVDFDIQKRTLTGETLEQMRKEAVGKRLDTLRHFRWAYAAFMGALQRPHIKGALMPTGALFEEPPVPESYEYVRLRFILSARSAGRRLQPLGRKLMKYRPDDYEVMYMHLFVTNAGRSAEARRECLGIAQRLVQLRPDSPNAYSMLARVYSQCWDASHRRADALAAIANYEEYLKRAAPDADWRQSAQRNIDFIRKQMVEGKSR